MLGSHNGTVSWEVWVLRANLERSVVARGDNQPARERAHLHFYTHNGIVSALVVRKVFTSSGANKKKIPRTRPETDYWCLFFRW